MKKSVYLVTAMVLLSIVLAACSSAANNITETPGAFGNGTQTGLGTPSTGLETTGPSTGTGKTPSATEAGTSAATAEVTKPATTAAKTPAATSSTGGLNTTPAVTTAPGAITNQPDAGRVKDLLKFSVQDQSGNKIGSVKNLVLNLDKGQCDYLIIDQGGILGIGAKSIAVPCQLFKFPAASAMGTTGATGSTAGTGSSTAATATPATGGTSSTPAAGANTPAAGGSVGTPATGTTGEGENAENVLILKVDKAALDNAPKFDSATLPQLGQTTGDWDNQLKTYWQQYLSTSGTASSSSSSTGSTGSTGASSTPAAGGTLSTPAAGSTSSTPAAGSTSSTPAAGGSLGTPASGAAGQSAAPMKFQGVVLADQVIGLAVNDDANNKIGDVQDIVLDTTNCKILYVVISYKDSTTNDTTLVPVPPTSFQLSGDGSSLVIANASTMLSGAPHFATDQFPFTLTKDWDKEIKAYWLSHGGSSPTTP